MDNLLAGKLILPFEGRLLAIVLSSAVHCPAAVENIPLQADHRSAIGSITDSLPGGITDRLQPGIVIGFPAES
jgi:hypothetical protein